MNKKIIALLLIAAVFILAAIIYTNPPGENKFYPPCIVKKFTGFDCAGCGSTRATYQLLHGNILKAADYNCMLLLMLPVIVIGLIHFFTGRLAALWKKINRPWLFLILIISFWIIRNIPVLPFTWLNSDK